jgi:hypothetical protein
LTLTLMNTLIFRESPSNFLWGRRRFSNSFNRTDTDGERGTGSSNSNIQAIVSKQVESDSNIKDELPPLETRLNQLQQEIADDKQLQSLAAERDFVTAVVNADFSPGKVPSVLTNGPLSHVAINTRDWMTEVNYQTLSLDDIEHQAHTIAETVPEPTADSGPRDRQTIALYAVAEMIETYIRHLRNNHDFDQERLTHGITGGKKLSISIQVSSMRIHTGSIQPGHSRCHQE